MPGFRGTTRIRRPAGEKTLDKLIHLIGFGSQGTAWAECLRDSGWQVEVYLGRAEGPSHERATQLGFKPRLTRELPATLSKASHSYVAMMCPDHLIGALYREFLAPVKTPVTLVLATGYAAYAGDLSRLVPGHAIAMIGPKAIGPKLRENFKKTAPGTHELVAAFHAPLGHEAGLIELARGLGFARENLVDATFAQEAIGDLISEQALLCGGIFTLLEWTMENMAMAGIPARLIREECLTELELIASMIREKGPASTLRKISQTAQCGTVAMRRRLEHTGLREALFAQAEDVKNGTFAEFMRAGAWREDAEEIAAKLEKWQRRLMK